MATRAEQIQQILKMLVANTPDVEGAAVVSVDGLILSSSCLSAPISYPSCPRPPRICVC